MSNGLTTYNPGDGWDDAADEANEQLIRGTILKFADWRWTAGQNGRLLPEGTKLAAFGTAAAWVRWEEGKPVQYIAREPGGHLPPREELGFLDKSKWERTPDGKDFRDPWANTRFVHLVDPATAEEYTFSTSSGGGVAAVSSLAGPIQRMRFVRPGAVPVVELRSQDMQTKFGKKSKPWLKIVDWVGGKLREPELQQIEHKSTESIASPELQRAIAEERRQSEQRNPPPAKVPVRGDMNDEIPF